MKEFKLSNGLIFPAVGYGTYLATKEKGTEAIAQAIEVGYRYFDTASFYMNEELKEMRYRSVPSCGERRWDMKMLLRHLTNPSIS